MAKKKRSLPKGRRRSKKQNGGGAGFADPASYSSGTSYADAIFGTGPSQWDRTFLQSSGPSQSNVITGAQGQRAGAKRNMSQKKSKSGGFWGHLVNQAIVPATIFGLQQTYRRKSKKSRGTRKKR
jgi:hypothetical protein